MKLKQIHPHLPTIGEDAYEVFVISKLQKSSIRFDFEVVCPNQVTQKHLPMGEPAWGLWETDVVEVFLKAQHQSHYFEFQISPLGQTFEMKILKPRTETDRNYRSYFRSGIKTDPQSPYWSAWMEVPFIALGWSVNCAETPEMLLGGAFACLGPKDSRRYFAAFLPDQNVPDFHLPEFFRPISNLK